MRSGAAATYPVRCDWRVIGGLHMFRILFAGVLAVMVGAMLGWIHALWDVTQNVYQWLYGKPMAHAKGDTLDHINDWLAFLPSDPATRGAIVAGPLVSPRLPATTKNASSIGIHGGFTRKSMKLKTEPSTAASAIKA